MSIEIVLFLVFLILFYGSIHLYEKKGKFKKFYHDILEWHQPEGEIYFDGCNTHSTCKYCGKSIMQDSYGCWF